MSTSIVTPEIAETYRAWEAEREDFRIQTQNYDAVPTDMQDYFLLSKMDIEMQAERVQTLLEDTIEDLIVAVEANLSELGVAPHQIRSIVGYADAEDVIHISVSFTSNAKGIPADVRDGYRELYLTDTDGKLTLFTKNHVAVNRQDTALV